MCRKVTLTINTGVKEVEIGQNVNYTRAADPIFKMAGLDNLDSFNGNRASDVAKTLSGFIGEIKAKQKEIENSVGYGSYIGAVTFLQSIYNICTENPACTVKIS